MENEHPRTAITRAGLTLEEFADIVQVDVKTVQRWLAGRTAPYRRNRARVAGALDTTEDALWPDAGRPPTESPERGQPMPGLTDVVAGYGYATDRDAPKPVDVLRSAAERIELVLPNVTPDIVDLLLARATEGCHARAIIEDPDGQLGPLLGIDGIELHASPGGEHYGLYRADEQMLLALHRIGAHIEPPPGFSAAPVADCSIGSPTHSSNAGSRRHRSPPASVYLAEAALEPDVEPAPRSPQSAASPIEPPRRWPGLRD